MTTLVPRKTVVKRAGRWGEVPDGFDAAVADVVYGRIMKCGSDEEAALYSAMLLGALAQHDLIVHGEAIAKASAVVLAKRISDLSTRLAKTAISKARDGDTHAQDVAVEALGQVITVAKAFSGDAFSASARAERARQQHRDLQSGKFVVEHHDVQYVSPDQGAHPLGDQQATAMGIKKPDDAQWKKMSRAQRMLYQQAYGQVSALVAPYAHVGDKGVLHLHYDDGTRETHKIPASTERIPISTAPGKALTQAQVSIVPPLYGDVDTGTALAMMGAPDLYNAVDHGVLDTKRLGQYTDAVRATGPQDQFIPSAGVFRRLGETSSLLSDSLGDVAPAKLRIALKVGRHVGSYGPEAQRVLGPTADKLAYRYRGTEKPVAAAITNALSSGAGPHKAWETTHGGVDQAGDWKPSPLLQVFGSKRMLPRADLNTLHHQAGNVPPSRGIIVDKTGKVTTESVGYADDHYLPFNLRKLPGLKGGQYIRTRTWGGPTTEDIYTGLVSGAKSITVVSHNGVYNVDFDDSLRGKRRFNDKAARMVGRYGQLLDAVRNGKVETAEIDPTRMQELRDKADLIAPEIDNPEGYDKELGRLVANERKHPTLSHAQTAQASLDFLDSVAAKRSTRDGHTQTAEELVSDLVTQRATHTRATHVREHGGAAGNLEEYRDAEMRLLTDPDPVIAGQKVADALGMRPQLDAAIKRASEQNRQTLKELSLNGPGYDVALQALQEQFPYYIANVEYHPWVNGSPGGFDTGYVRPGRNRPQKALSGYFDSDLGGKVMADSTRWQRTAGLKTAEVPAHQERPAQPAPGAPAPARNAAADQQAQVNAAAEIVRHLQNPQTTFAADGIQLPDAQRKYLANQPVSVKALEMQGPEYAELRHMVGTPLEEQLKDPVALIARAKKVNAQSRSLGFGVVPEQASQAFAQAGEKAASSALGDVDAMLNLPNAEYELQRFGAPFAQGSNARTDEIANLYRSDPDIAHSVREGALPAHPADPGFAEAAGKRAEQLRLTRAGQLAHQRGQIASPPPGAAELPVRARGLVKANQLHRRHADADASEKRRQAELEAAKPTEYTTNELHIHGGGDNNELSTEQEQGLQILRDLGLPGLAPGS